MQDAPTGTFDALNPPAVDYPTFTPPVAEPFATPFAPGTPTAPIAPPTFDPSNAFTPIPDAPLFPSTPKKVFTKIRVIAAVVGLAIIGLGIGTVSQAAKADRLNKQLEAKTRDVEAQSREINRLNGVNSSLNSTVSGLRADKSDLEDRNSTLAEFGASVSVLVSELNSCVDDMNQFILDLGDNPWAWSSGRIGHMVDQCTSAQTQANSLDNALTS